MRDASEIDRDLAGRIDHTALKADVSPGQILTLCDEALSYGFASVCINPSYVDLAAEALNGRIPVCTVIGFPLGATSTSSKLAEAEQAFRDGATEFDMVLHVGRLKIGDSEYVENEIRSLAELVHSLRRSNILKVIIETCMLSDEEKGTAAGIVSSAGADFIKTSTGFGSGGATIADVELLRALSDPMVRVKASGGIRTRSDALAFIRAGADRIGASASIDIVRQ